MLHRVLNQTHIASKMIHIVLSSFVVSNRLMLCLCCARFCETTHVTSNIYKYICIHISYRILSFYLECYLKMAFHFSWLYYIKPVRINHGTISWHHIMAPPGSGLPGSTKEQKATNPRYFRKKTIGYNRILLKESMEYFTT